MIWFDKWEKYSGSWKNNLQNGLGLHIWFDELTGQRITRPRYIGEWENGKRNGFGIFIYSNGNTYKGFWKNNLKNGFGEFTFEDRTKYIGRFHNDIMLDKNNQIPYDKIDLEISKKEKQLKEEKVDIKQKSSKKMMMKTTNNLSEASKKQEEEKIIINCSMHVSETVKKFKNGSSLQNSINTTLNHSPTIVCILTPP